MKTVSLTPTLFETTLIDHGYTAPHAAAILSRSRQAVIMGQDPADLIEEFDLPPDCLFDLTD